MSPDEREALRACGCVGYSLGNFRFVRSEFGSYLEYATDHTQGRGEWVRVPLPCGVEMEISNTPKSTKANRLQVHFPWGGTGP